MTLELNATIAERHLDVSLSVGPAETLATAEANLAAIPALVGPAMEIRGMATPATEIQAQARAAATLGTVTPASSSSSTERV